MPKASQARPSKFSPRPLGPNQLERHRLLSLLERHPHARLVLIHAPAGFGKTTLLAQWQQRLASDGQGSGWITTDDDDNDAGRFGANLCQALCPDAAAIRADLFDSINCCLEAWPAFTLFVDELEHLSAPDAIHLLEVMLDNAPARWHLVVGSRSLPKLLPARLRIRGDFLELTSRDLAFQGDEIPQFMRARCVVPLQAETYESLARRTEGWVAALQLAAVAITQGEPAHTVIEHLVAPRSDLFRYLSDEVLTHLPPERCQFLLQTSFLSELSGPLCDAVTGRGDSDAVLAELEQANLLLLPIDRRRTHYRYHPLFADCLRQQMRCRYAGELPELARRASDWCAQAQLQESAVEYALLTGDSAYVIASMTECVESLIACAQFSTIKRWLRAVPQQALEQRPDLLTWAAWVDLYVNDFAAAQGALAKLEQLAITVPIALRERMSDSILRAMLLIQQARFAEALATTEAAWQQADQSDRQVVARLNNLRGLLAQTQGRFAEAAQAAERVLAMAAETPPIWLSLVHAAHISGLTELALGNLAGARRRFEAPGHHLRAQPGESGQQVNPRQLQALLAGPLALVFYEQNRLDDAEGCLDRHGPFLNTMFSPSSRVLYHQLRARLRHLRGDEDGHAAALAEGRAFAIRHEILWMEAAMQWEQVAHDIMRDDLNHARSIASRLLEDTALETAPDWIASCEEVFGPVIGAIRYLICSGDASQALNYLRVHIDHSERQLRRLRLTKLRVLEALACEALGERERALAAMRVAVELGMRSDAIRTFADEGASCATLLRELERATLAAPGSPAYLRRLLAAFDGAEDLDDDDTAGAEEASYSAVSVRELQILQRLAEGNSNLAVGQQLFLSPNTIKWHLRQLYVKLGVKNRTQAVHVARQQRLLPLQ